MVTIRTNFIEKYQVWFLTHLGVLIMALMLLIDPTNRKLLTSYSGYSAVGFLITVLSLNPLKKLFPKWLLITYLSRYRQEFGVAAFFYATIHLVCFVIKRGSIMNTLPYAFHPAIGPVLLVAYPIFLILALTSNQYSMKKLTHKKWKKIHRFVYVAEGAVIIHMVMVGQKFWAAVLFMPLVILQFLRKRKK